jgi:hypothetical protein
VEALFWYGFALPIPPLLTLVRVVLVIAASNAPEIPMRPSNRKPWIERCNGRNPL